jgi:hypothetical protein
MYCLSGRDFFYLSYFVMHHDKDEATMNYQTHMAIMLTNVHSI